MFVRLLIFSLLLFTVNLFSGTGIGVASVLTAVSRSDETTSLQLFLHFDTLPEVHLSTTGRRVTLELAATSMARQISLPEIDGRMIKIVPTELPTKVLFSIYFRYPPQKVTAEHLAETGVLLLDVLLGNQLSTSFPELSTKLQGVSVVKRARSDSLNPVNISEFAKNWLSFFTTYELPVVITPPPHLHLPPFPLAAAVSPTTETEQWLPSELQNLAQDNKWTQVCLLVREQINIQPLEPFKERLVLTYAEALLRMGEYREPYFLLQRIMIQYPDSQLATIAHLLLLYQQASRGDFINTYYEVLPLVKEISSQTPFADDLHLLLAELALLSSQTKEAEQLLTDPTFSRNAALTPLRLLRLADLLYRKGEKVKALTAYMDSIDRSSIIQSDPLSLTAFCDCLYTAKRYQEATKWYMRLGDLLHNHPSQDLVLYRAALAQLHVPATEKKARIDIGQILDAFPQTEGGVLALLKQTDLDFVAKKIEPHEALAVYDRGVLYGSSPLQREECLFKKALVHHLSAEHAISVDICMQLLREFHGGKLRTEAMALLIQQLPGVISQLVADEEYVKALVLAKQNKKLFVRGWLKPDLLLDLAKAYGKLDMTDQAAQTYQYLFEVSEDAAKEQIYLPLLQSLFAEEKYRQVEEYADRYQMRFPRGKDAPAIFLLKAQALYHSGHLDQALKLLTMNNAPKSPQLELLKGRIYAENKQWPQLIETLGKPDLQKQLAPNRLLLPLAEAFFQTGKNDEARDLFQQLASREEENEQAHFRLAQIAFRQNNPAQALKLFQQLAEKGKDPLWKKMAREEAAILEMRQ